MSHEPKAPFLFVVDTDSYAGNFERDLCAYITGCIGDCGVGEDMAELYDKEVGVEPFTNPFEDIIISEPDEHGCHRPVTIYGGAYNSVAISFEKRPTQEQITLMKERTYRFATLKNEWSGAPRIKTVTGFRLIKQFIKRDEQEEGV